MSLIQLHEITTGVKRGRLRGLWCQYHPIASFADADVFAGSGSLAGKAFYIVKFINVNPNGVQHSAIMTQETSDTWETN